MFVKTGKAPRKFYGRSCACKVSEQFWERLLAGPQNEFNIGGVWWLEGNIYTMNSSTNMFLDLMEMAAGRRLSDTIVVSCV